MSRAGDITDEIYEQIPLTYRASVTKAEIRDGVREMLDLFGTAAEKDAITDAILDNIRGTGS